MNPETDWIPLSVAMPTSNDVQKDADEWLCLLGARDGIYDCNGWKDLASVHEGIREAQWTHWKRLPALPRGDSNG